MFLRIYIKDTWVFGRGPYSYQGHHSEYQSLGLCYRVKGYRWYQICADIIYSRFLKLTQFSNNYLFYDFSFHRKSGGGLLVTTDFLLAVLNKNDRSVIFCFVFISTLLRCNWQICKIFKVCIVIIWYTHTWCKDATLLAYYTIQCYQL